MRYGFHFFDFNIPGEPQSLSPQLRSAATAADEMGASWFTVMDHYFQMEQFRTALDPMLEGYTTLGFLAGVTSQVKLGTVVTGVTYRHPGLLSKIVTTLDVLSEGRAFLGIGAAWYEREHLALGVPYPPLAERFERLEEALQIALQMWGPDNGPYQGKHFQLAETISVPAPIQTPHPPIVIGGSGERKTLRMVAQYAQATNLIVPDAAAAAHKLAVLREHCDDLGRDYDSIEKTAQSRLQPGFTVNDVLASASALAAVGIEHVHFGVLGPDVAGSIARFGDEAAARLAEIEVGYARRRILTAPTRHSPLRYEMQELSALTSAAPPEKRARMLGHPAFRTVQGRAGRFRYGRARPTQPAGAARPALRGTGCRVP